MGTDPPGRPFLLHKVDCPRFGAFPEVDCPQFDVFVAYVP